MPLLIVVIGVALLLLLMIKFKVNGFISLILVALVVGIAEGMNPAKAVSSIQNGVGSTLSSLALILGFGAMFGKLIADSGAAQRISRSLINKFGVKKIQWAVVLTGFIVGIAMFYEVGFVLLIPLVFTIAEFTELPLLYIGVPMAAALSVTHGFLPPHPGPVAIATIYGASISMTLVYGIVIAIPTVIVAGPVLTKFLKRFDHKSSKNLFKTKVFDEDEMPSFSLSVLTAIVPPILMAFSAVCEITLPKTSPIRHFAEFVGSPMMAMFISIIVAIFTLGIMRGKKMEEIMRTLAEAASSIAMILLIVAGGGAFKQVLIDSGVGKYIASIMVGSNISPLILAWAIAAILRLSLGSATVSAMTTAGIVLPLIPSTHANPALMVLATGAGSLIFSHVNDPGFWMFKEYFGLSIGETMASWSTLETIISIMGLIGVLALNMVG
ncbi:Gnt-II system L-idonate transporter [Clostridium acetobutylicum]|uniref:High affinity gluconate/L-idonate permease n=1 Tax=Clostridium acetobutylicum (strain ATCC 824 / DSM 792 / JCM 1419 / IAM 19013 / LMG 5710 / NBRC 13948 / NRRL B-527 / VKM B-1787 / 2291 / W) TaxID=272562 RepID=Q97D75_CLOAB|nr:MULTISPECIES: gluconate:H+ symporter [Clostridium]AAK81528.1 High affinity gluconate/L-idonate permease [Clostridium acetobutylicum ATCC 824]ADZ22649.1 High affinity gluconate/L-idonate permease [Clostridium acetobutylicum EA 2018]AEI34269.1 high affinity gluconate/L-idonate permease [Clostridium acetobutylicum DSM 1731]AWV80799.1 gluconate permease [Clostridium acetobutylicum]MBC2393876.1 TRAP transporter large permease subunit [Clostridium acetobutylicum]